MVTRLSCPQSPAWPPSAALTRQKGWGTAEASGQVSRRVPASPAPRGSWELQALSGSILARTGRPLAAQFHSLQGQSVAEAEPSSGPECLALGAPGWHRARQSTHVHTRVGSRWARGGGVARCPRPLWRTQGHLGLTAVVGHPVSGGLRSAP